MSRTAWIALADRFRELSNETDFDLQTFPSESIDPLSTDGSFRLVYNVYHDQFEPAERITVSAHGSLTLARQLSLVNRFRWLSWAAGLLVDPLSPAPSEVSWWLGLRKDGEQTAKDMAARSTSAASDHAEASQRRHRRQTLSAKGNQSWEETRNVFGRLRDRFSSTVFHGTRLALAIGVPFGYPDEAWWLDQDPNGPRGVDDPLRRSPHLPTMYRGGNLWGGPEAVEEFRTVAESAHSELQSDFRLLPDLFPSINPYVQIGCRAGWTSWCEFMYLMCPAQFDILSPTTQRRCLVLRVKGRPELVAAKACGRVADSESPLQLLRTLRLHLARFSPWLSDTERLTAEEAVRAAEETSEQTEPTEESVILTPPLHKHQATVLNALDGKVPKQAGRPPDPMRPKIMTTVQSERKKGTEWADIPAVVQKKHGRKLSLATLQRYFRGKNRLENKDNTNGHRAK
jgi:hypothetical protein